MDSTPNDLQAAAWEQIAVPGVPAPEWKYDIRTSFEVYDLRPDFPDNPVIDYPDPNLVPDQYAYQVVNVEAPHRVYDIPGPVHTAYVDATVASEVGLGVQNMQAPLPAYANVPGYGLGTP